MILHRNPIATAPKDGTWVLLFGGEPDHWYDDGADIPAAVVARWDDKSDPSQPEWRFASYDGGLYGTWHNPEAWAVLPRLVPAP